MAISGLVITLSGEPSEAEAAVRVMSGDSRLTLGERFGRRLAAVAETPGPAADRELWEELSGLAGVTLVDVAFVGLDAPEGTRNQEPEVCDARD